MSKVLIALYMLACAYFIYDSYKRVPFKFFPEQGKTRKSIGFFLMTLLFAMSWPLFLVLEFLNGLL